MIRKALAISFASACIGAFALVVTPDVSFAASSKAQAAKSKKKAKKAVTRAGQPQNKQMRMQYNPPGSRFPSSWRY